MCKLLEDRINEGRVQERIIIAARLLQKNKCSIEEIAELAKLPIDTVQQIEAELKGISA